MRLKVPLIPLNFWSIPRVRVSFHMATCSSVGHLDGWASAGTRRGQFPRKASPRAVPNRGRQQGRVTIWGWWPHLSARARARGGEPKLWHAKRRCLGSHSALVDSWLARHSSRCWNVRRFAMNFHNTVFNFIIPLSMKMESVMNQSFLVLIVLYHNFFRLATAFNSYKQMIKFAMNFHNTVFNFIIPLSMEMESVMNQSFLVWIVLYHNFLDLLLHLILINKWSNLQWTSFQLYYTIKYEDGISNESIFLSLDSFIS
jgi:hypothetical protein